jgi:hypothetical protein
MRTAAMAVLAVAASLTGCSRSDSRGDMELQLYEIRSLCSKVGNKAMADSPVYFSNGQERPDAKIVLEWTKEGTAAQCELEYRIKQQEANKPF